MEKKNLSDLTSAELIAKEKTLKTVLGVSIGALSVLVLMIILLFFQKQSSIGLPLIFVVLGSGITLINIPKELKAVKAEIEARGNILQ
jgi:hypothetical protein